MKPHTAVKRNQQVARKRIRKQVRQMAGQQRLTIGLDLGDRTSRYCILDEAGEVVSEGQAPTTTAGLQIVT